jgi:hypothetical protein
MMTVVWRLILSISGFSRRLTGSHGQLNRDAPRERRKHNAKRSEDHPCLWFDDQAEEAAKFYTAIFHNSKIISMTRYGEAGHEIHGRPDGTVMTVHLNSMGTPLPHSTWPFVQI